MAQIFGIGSPGGSVGGNGGKFYAYNNISNAGPIPVAPVNQNRVAITFWNPGSQTIYIAPAIVISLANPANQALTPSLAALGGCVPVLPGGWISFQGECQGAFQALAAAGTTNPLTVIDSNVSGG